MADEQKNEQQQQTTENNAEPPAWVKDLQTSMQAVGTGINTLVDLAKQSATRPAKTEPEPEPEDGSDLLEGVELETMPRKSFAERIMATMEDRIQGMLKPLADKITEQGQGLLQANYMQEAEKFAARTPDFAEWTEEMTAIAKDNPNLQISRIYAIAKAENPEKALKVAEKYKKETTTETKPPPRKAPLALSTSSNSAETRNQRMGAEEASRDAWEKAVAQFGNPFENTA